MYVYKIFWNLELRPVLQAALSYSSNYFFCIYVYDIYLDLYVYRSIYLSCLSIYFFTPTLGMWSQTCHRDGVKPYHDVRGCGSRTNNYRDLTTVFWMTPPSPPIGATSSRACQLSLTPPNIRMISWRLYIVSPSTQHKNTIHMCCPRESGSRSSIWKRASRLSSVDDVCD